MFPGFIRSINHATKVIRRCRWAAIVSRMVSAYAQNDILLSMLSTLAGENVDLDPVRKAFEETRGGFRARFAAAVQARLAQMVTPEVFIDVPEHPEQLHKPELEALVRPAANAFLPSYPTKAELLEHLGRIQRRQQHRPTWIPRIDPNSNPITPPEPDPTERVPDRPLVVAALAEIDEVTVMLPEAGEDRPELAMAPGGIGEWESALYTLLGLVGEDAAARTITIDAAANEALVPEDVRWWSPEPPQPVPASQDPGAASELLATSPVLGGLVVTDNTPEGYETVVDALAAAGDWRYSPQWQLETWIPADDSAALAVARAAAAGWADEHHSGVIMYVYGGTMYSTNGLVGTPGPLHSYLLAATRSTDGTDSVASIHRVIWTCPGEHWCHRGGCPDIDNLEIAALLNPIITAAHAADTALDNLDGDWPETHHQLYGDGDGPDYVDRVLEVVTGILTRAGWVELEESSWEGGLEQTLLRRGEHCLLAAYDPVTRQIQLADGKDELEMTLQILADDGVLIGDDGAEHIDTSDTALERWGSDLLAAADDLLHERITTCPRLTSPARISILGLHPHADGTLRGPHAATFAERQLNTFLATVGVLKHDG